MDSFATQRAFTSLMQAMGQPGRTYRIQPIDRISPIMSVLMTLLDNEVTFAVEDPILEDSIRTATGSQPAPLEETDFLVVPSGDSGGAILRVKRGELRYPDSGATVIYMVESLASGSMSIKLTGPGIRSENIMSLEGWGRREALALKEANAGYPLGVDCILVDAEGRVACIPRSSRIEVM
jgi:alpha-D-ribose 1-methylphosphonate 5-triphosphate synthase subunit PhnH